MLDDSPSIYSLIVLVLLSVVHVTSLVNSRLPAALASVRPLSGLFLALAVSEWISFIAALWILALISFCALREYLSLVDIRLEDRWGILVSYLSIPFMFYLIQIDWYGFFIIAIPVYTFLLMPVFLAFGGRSRGIVFSVGVLDFGLFFYVFCMGHLCYLAFFSERIAMLMIATVAAADFIHGVLRSSPQALRVPLQVVVACSLLMGLAGWSGIPLIHSLALGFIIPLVVCLGRFTLREIEEDLGIRANRLQPGRGRTIDALKSYLFIAPVVFHYLRWFLTWGDL